MAQIKSKYAEKDARLWIQHWDHQIYKALEASYQWGLECIHESIPEIKVDVVFVNKNLECKPPLEQIRQQYYRELKKFVNIPYTFDGFGGNSGSNGSSSSSIYKKMGARNAKRLLQVYGKYKATKNGKISASIVSSED